MALTGKEYLMPLQNDEAKKKFRQWMGAHNGMSIMKSEWVWCDNDRRHFIDDAYIIKITNPRTELLFCLAFPEAKNLEGVDRDSNEWRQIDP